MLDEACDVDGDGSGDAALAAAASADGEELLNLAGRWRSVSGNRFEGSTLLSVQFDTEGRLECCEPRGPRLGIAERSAEQGIVAECLFRC
jgi:hypothetical protein